MRDAMPEAQVEIKGRNFPTDPKKITVVLGGKHRVDPEEAKAESLTFRVPRDAAPGRYFVVVELKDDSKSQFAVPGELRVLPGTFVIAGDTRLPDVMPEERVEIKGERFPTQRGNIEVILGDKHRITPEEADGKSLAFRVPRDFPPGRYSVVIESTAEPKAKAPVPGELRVKPKGPPKITTVSPLTGYPTEHKQFDFTIVGENFGQRAEDNDVIINGIPLGKNARDDGPCNAAESPTQKLDKPCLAVVDSSQLRLFGVNAQPYQGPIKIQVRAYEAVSQPPSPATLSRIKAGAVLPAAVILFALVSAALLYLVWKGMGRYKIGGEFYSPFKMFFLDKDTNTYSLSKLQLLAWTAAAAFGYIYLMTANLMIQWRFALPDLPDGLPLMLGISGGTTITAIGLNSHVGGKGSGPVSPTPADFIMTGGIVAAERLQYFIWTIIGIGGFLSLLLSADPSTLQKLPSLPENFLTIMGISSAAYLGGKAIRKPGPVIRTLSVVKVTEAGQALLNPKPPDPATPGTPPPQPKGPVLTINLKGENLDAGAGIKIDEKMLRNDQFWLTPKKPPEPPLAQTAELDVNLDVGLIEEVDQQLLEGEHTLTLINADGQSSSVHFPIDPMKIDAITKKPDVGGGPPPPAAASAAPVAGAAAPAGPAADRIFVVSGRNFPEPPPNKDDWVNKFTCVFQDPGGKPGETIPVVKPLRLSSSQLEVTLQPPGNRTGSAKLTITSNVGLKASFEFQI